MPTLRDGIYLSRQAEEILELWINAGPKRWFRRDVIFDAEIRRRFSAVHLAAEKGEYLDWRKGACGALALLLLTDQFPRNMYRDTAHAFATDLLAHATAEEALGLGFDLQFDLELQPFFYLPLEHSESNVSQTEALKRLEAYVQRGGDESYLRYARRHADAIARFGRFPHRNRALGRTSTPDELAYLAGGGFSG